MVSLFLERIPKTSASLVLPPAPPPPPGFQFVAPGFQFVALVYPPRGTVVAVIFFVARRSLIARLMVLSCFASFLMYRKAKFIRWRSG